MLTSDQGREVLAYELVRSKDIGAGGRSACENTASQPPDSCRERRPPSNHTYADARSFNGWPTKTLL
jgi:hypothetical protein